MKQLINSKELEQLIDTLIADSPKSRIEGFHCLRGYIKGLIKRLKEHEDMIGK